ncbi:MAG: DNA translocase FtsK 4TM domain-containing protein [Candidatus Koribacter versatilis]|uniref:DNA translocase FtsK 4TM domain-containing protein n=1 Tax=Candidatus Korobacter versatilis TaxID=658062 RepID=A0A932A713_9BACT|nr:DNA translocase FtsK 4TM domain-containing protein [Candidatus Koribacter versatilis]
MKYFVRVFTPTNNKRFNELIGFLLLVGAVLLLLSLVSYSPLDPSLNTAASSSGALRPTSAAARNWVGIAGAFVADLLLQFWGITVFLAPVMVFLLAMRWFRSRPVDSPVAKTIGATTLLVFTPALLGLMPWPLRWIHAVPVEGLLGRIVGDALIHYFNLTGAYIVSLAVILVALYLSTAFSFGAMQLWAQTRFAFAFAAWDRLQDWRTERARAKAARELERRRMQKPVVTAQLVTQKRPLTQPAMSAPQPAQPQTAYAPPPPLPIAVASYAEPQPAAVMTVNVAEPGIGTRADAGAKTKTTMPRIAGGFKLPSTSLLHRSEEQHAIDEVEVKTLAQVLTDKLAEFDVTGQVTHINPGPVVTTFEYKPEAGIKYSRVTGLTEDLCLAMRAESILIERMAGKSTVGIQVPNRERETIWLREVIESQEFMASKSKLALAMGKDINGRIVTAELQTMPHLLIAGSTGAGKSVAINAMIMSILYKSTPDQVRLILVDPKRLELGVYEGVPHLFTPIITEPKVAAYALRNAVREMERRLKLLAEKGVRNLEQYNKTFDDTRTPSLFQEGDDTTKPLPYIVIIIDELADLMMLDQHNVEESITRLAQMARAVGIHLILATQRPSVDVITGLIKANFPARVSFRVATKVDSRTILDANGAESLLGRGDMLYLPSGSARVHRLHAPFVTEKEIGAVVEFWRAQGLAQYEEKFLQAPKEEGGAVGGGAGDGEEGEPEHDDLFEDAVRLVLEFGKASTSLLQRRLRIGYGRAAHLIDLMERDGIVGAPDGPKPREILKRPDWLKEVEESLR